MDIRECKCLGEVICSLTILDKDYIFVRHELAPGQKVGLHYHKNADEWVVVKEGKFVVRSGRKEMTFDLQYGDNKILVIRFPKRRNHSFRAESIVSYFVFRSCQDEIIYLEKEDE